MKLSLKTAIAALALVIPSMGAQAFSASSYPTASRLSSGHWVRVTTDHEGIFQLTDDNLREMGFADPTKVRVWTVDAFELAPHKFTTELASSAMIQAPSVHTDDGRLLFYGQGDARLTITSTAQTAKTFTYTRNYYDRVSSYLLTDSEYGEDLKVQSYITPTSRPAVYSHISVALTEEELDRIVHGVFAQGRRYSSGEEVPFSFHVRNWSPSANVVNGYLHYVMAAQTSLYDNQMSLVLPEGVEQVRMKNYASNKAEYPVAYSDAIGYLWFKPQEGEDFTDRELTFKVKIPDIDYRYVAADRFMLAYPRANKVDAVDPDLVMVLPTNENSAGQEIRFADAPATLRVWSIDQLRAPVELDGRDFPGEGTTGGYRSYTLPRKTMRLVAFDEAATFPTPETVGAVANDNLAGMDTPDYLIITTDELQPYAEDLARLHRERQGLDVAVVTQSRIAAEYAAGGRNAMSLRLFVKMLYDRNPQKLKYLLFYGPSTSDNRFVLGPIDFETIVCYENNNNSQAKHCAQCYVGDTFFGMVDDAYKHELISTQPAQIAVGRVPARTAAQARDFNKKAERWFAEGPSAANQNTVVLLSGTNNGNAHLQHCLDVEQAMKGYRPDYNFYQLPNKAFADQSADNYPRHRIMLDLLRRGVGYLSYSGHGAAEYVDNYEMLSTHTVINDRYWAPPFVTLASCAQFGFDLLGTSLLENMLLFREGGAIAGVGACREVYLTHNLATCLSVARAFAAAGPGATMGSVWLEARRIALADYGTSLSNYEPEALINHMCYNLAGDPAMPLYPAARTIRVDNVSGAPMQSVTFTGAVLNASGDVDSDFNGPARVDIFDGVHTVQSLNNYYEPDFVPLDFDMEIDLLSQAQTQVVNGLFSVNITLPEPVYKAETYRITVTANRAGNNADGAVGTGRLTLSDLPADVDRSGVPEVKELYAAGPDFVPGDCVEPDFTLYAVVDDGGSGLSFGTAGVASRTRLVIDGSKKQSGVNPYFTRQDDGTYRLAYPVSGLSDGYHDIELFVANNAGRIASRSVEVLVVGHADAGKIVLDEECVADAAVIGLEDTSAAVTRLTVQDSEGHTVFTTQNPAMPYRWDLKDNDGNTCPDGRYIIKMNVRDNHSYGMPAPATLVILR